MLLYYETILCILNNSTIGYVSWIGEYSAKNSVLVDILEASGAVLYVKTNVPQTLMVRIWKQYTFLLVA